MRVDVLAEDRELARAVPPGQLATARGALWAPGLTVPRGPWVPPSPGPAPGIGILVLEGLLTRDVHIAGGVSAELLGRGDVLRPWDDDGPGAPVPAIARWHVLEPARIAILDRHFTHTLCAWPDLVIGINSRLLRRARWLACINALSAIHRLEPRLLALLWNLADRWGTVEPEGVILRLALTHRVLARLIGAERPSVSRSMCRLRAAGAVTPLAGGGWLLHRASVTSLQGVPVTRDTALPVALAG